MKIDDKGLQGPRLDGGAAVRPATGGATGTTAPRTDVVNVSDTARQLAQLRTDVGDPMAIREDKVEGLRAVMAKGHYSADLGAVATKFLRETLGELLA